MKTPVILGSALVRRFRSSSRARSGGASVFCEPEQGVGKQEDGRRAPDGYGPPAGAVGDECEDQDARDLSEAGEEEPDERNVRRDPE